MREKIKMIWYTDLPALISLIVGIVLTAFPNILSIVCRLGGGILILSGLVLLVYNLLKKAQPRQYVLRCILLCVGGIALCILPAALTLFVPLILGAWLIVSSISDFYSQFFVEKRIRLFGIAVCTLGLLVGIFVISRPRSVFEGGMRLIGIAMIIHSVLRLIAAFFAARYTVSQPASSVILDTTLTDKE